LNQARGSEESGGNGGKSTIFEKQLLQAAKGQKKVNSDLPKGRKETWAPDRLKKKEREGELRYSITGTTGRFILGGKEAGDNINRA